MSSSPERSWYSVAEVAQLLGVSRTTVWRWIRAGQLPARRVGPRTLRVERHALDALAASAPLSEYASQAEGTASRRVAETARVYTVNGDAEQRRTAVGSWSDDAGDRGRAAVPGLRGVDAERAARKRAALFNGYDPERVQASLREHGGSWSDLDTDAILDELYEAREAGTRPVDER